MKLLRHSLYNFLGLGLPLIAAVFCMPALIKELGDERFGLLTLIWAVTSYFGLFDFGLGRALTQQIVVADAEKRVEIVAPLVATAISIMGLLGGAAGILMWILAPWGVGLIKFVPNAEEAIRSVILMALSMPAIILTSGFRGVLEARHAFGALNVMRLMMGLFTFIGPLVTVLYWTTSLDGIAAVLVLGRVVACVFHAWYAWKILNIKFEFFVIDLKFIKPLCTSGGWLALSGFITPLMGYFDRFLIAGLVSAAAVTHYTTPQELVSKIWIIPSALTMVLFPVFSSQRVLDKEGGARLFKKSLRYLFLAVFPATYILCVFAKEILSVWLGDVMANESILLMQIFSVGILINCMAHVPYTMIQGYGKPWVAASISIVQLPFYLILIWLVTGEYGVLGTALVWFLRVIFDTFLIFILCGYINKWPIKYLLTKRFFVYSGIAAVAFSEMFVDDFYLRFFMACIAAVLWVVIAGIELINWKKSNAVF